MKFKFIVLLFSLIILSCESSINIIPPTILIENTSPSVLEEIKIVVKEYGDIDGVRIEADYFEWTIEDFENNLVKNDFSDSSTVYWTPEKAGHFIIRVRIGYDSNKSITAVKGITVTESPISLMTKIKGHWIGTGVSQDQKEWGIDIQEWGIDIHFENNGRYYGTAIYESFEPYCAKGVFNEGYLEYYSGNVFDSCSIPGHVYCQHFEIQEVKDNKGSGTVHIGWTTYIDGELFQQWCTEVYDLEELELSSNGDTLYFEFNYPGQDEFDWLKKFQLIRQ